MKKLTEDEMFDETFQSEEVDKEFTKDKEFTEDEMFDETFQREEVDK